MRRALVGRTLVLAAGLAALSPAAAHAAGPVFGPAVKLAGSAAGFTEPRDAITTDDNRFVITNDNATGDAVVYRSTFPGTTWTRTASEPAGQTAATPDVDIVASQPFAGAPHGRLVAAELDDGGINFRVSYSDDEGKTWQSSVGSELGDTDRQWLATGPLDPSSGKPRVYLLFHNLASGTASHNMYVQTSTDGGANFGPPVPITLPPSQAWQDLQCADSGGPSDLFVNQKTGRVYAVWGTRSAPLAGGCGSSVFGPFEINVVGATRVWIASSPDGVNGWNDVLAVNDSPSNGGSGQLVGMQLAPGGLDNQGNVYIVYPESPHAYPDYSGAAIKYVSAPGDLSKWSAPVTVAPAGGAGHVLPHIVAGDPGKLDLAYYTGEDRAGKTPAWYMTVAQVLPGAHGPQITQQRLSSLPTYTGTASDLMGACDHDASDPTAGIQNGFSCDRSSDVWAVTLDSACRLVTSWHLAGDTQLNDADPQNGGSWVATQTSGTTVCAKQKAH